MLTHLISSQEGLLSWLLRISGIQDFSIGQSASLINSEKPYLEVCAPKNYSFTARCSEEQTSAQRCRRRPHGLHCLIPASLGSSSQLQSHCTEDTSQRRRGGQGRGWRCVHEWPSSQDCIVLERELCGHIVEGAYPPRIAAHSCIENTRWRRKLL